MATSSRNLESGMKVIAVVLMIVAVLSVGELKAEPDSTVRYLMNEPMTMFEWGMYRLKTDLNSPRDDEWPNIGVNACLLRLVIMLHTIRIIIE